MPTPAGVERLDGMQEGGIARSKLFLFDPVNSVWRKGTVRAAGATLDETLLEYLLTASALYGFDGTDLRRLLVESTTNANLRIGLYNGSTQAVISTIGDGADWNGSAGLMTSSRGVLYNGATWDRQRSNVVSTLLASAARTTSTNAADQVNYNGRGVLVIIDITATPNDAQTLILRIQAKDSASGKYQDLISFGTLTASVLGATPTIATYLYMLYPGAVETTGIGQHEIQGAVLPRNWRVQVSHSAAGSWTYSVSAEVIL